SLKRSGQSEEIKSMGETLLNGRYRLIAQQGSGGMAVIYKAVDQYLGRTVAVKVLRPSLTADPSFVARFRNEARSVANLSHPNIVTVHDVGSDGQTHYIVMEYVEGLDLKKIIRREGMLSVDLSLDLAIQICAGIGFAHRAGIVHADVKPQNILVTEDYRVKVTDFGIAQALTDTQPTQRQDVVWGSPHYFAPEQARGEKPTPASDVYAIGIVLFEMLTGRLPYSGASQQELAMAHLRERIPLVTEVNPLVPENLSKIIYKVMSKEPSARYRMADQLGHILRSYRERSRALTSSTTPQVPPTLPEDLPMPPPLQQSRPYPPQSASARPPNVPQPTTHVWQPDESKPLARPEYPSPSQQFRPASQPFQPLARSTSPISQAAQPESTPAPWEANRGSSGLYVPPPAYDESNQPSGRLDFVTISLATIALVAVFGLIPLYILVFRAWNGS
ncbi:MAG: protein kinase, partial [Anaerolineae bacterium]|nr:protein kinase [Anaerolineae bacterium]